MCQFKSFILLKNGDILHKDSIDSHEDLIEIFNINDFNDLSIRNFVRCEFVPSATPVEVKYGDIDSYKLIIDEDFTPDWVNEIRESTISKIKDIVKSYIIQDQNTIFERFAIITGRVDKISESSRVIIAKTGIVEANHGDVIENHGIVDTNYNIIDHNREGSILRDNHGVARFNRGNVDCNWGYINYNHGDVRVNFTMIMKNHGKITDNQGMIKNNYGSIQKPGFVRNNYAKMVEQAIDF